MGRFLMGAFTLLLIIGAACLIIWGLDILGIISTKTLVLQVASDITGIHDLTESYNLGKRRGDILKEREAELNSLKEKLQADSDKLLGERALFEAERLKWQKEHLATNETPQKVGKPGKTTTAKNPGEVKAKAYLQQIGNMKPAKAAEVVQKLPEATVFMIFEELPSSKVSKIMESLPADYLARLTRERLRQSQIPN